MTIYDETTLARLLRALPPPPTGWVQAAQELPRARVEIDEIVARAEADAEFRRAMLADLESALATAGYTPTPALVVRVRERLLES